MADQTNNSETKLWDFDRIASCCAIFIALVAMVVAVYEARVTREHQEISVWPMLTTYSTSLAKVGDSYKNFGVVLKNEGLGPAIIKRITYKYNGEEYQGIQDIVLKVIPDQTNYIRTDKKVIRIILPGEEKMLYATDFTQKNKEKFGKAIGGNLAGEICYCSLYERCWKLETTKFTEVKSCD